MSLKLIALYWLCLTSSGVFAKPEVPQLPISRTASKFYLIQSEQTTHIEPSEHFRASTWQVSEYFNLQDGGTSISWHQKSNSNEHNYALVSTGGRFFYCATATSIQECHLDRRHDHSTLFPWRYVSRSAHPRDLRLRLAGVGALWLNGLEDGRLQCDSQLRCLTGDSSQSQGYALDFEGAQLRAARVWRDHSIHSDQSSVVHRVQVELAVSSQSPVDELDARSRQLLELCAKQLEELTREADFPSLMHELAASEQRVYRLDYSVRLYEPPRAPGREEQLLDSYVVRESFSYKHETQSLGLANFRTARAYDEHYLRIFNIMRGRSVNYRMERADSRLLKCAFGALDGKSPLVDSSRLMHRSIGLGSKLSEAQLVHQGELIGLGALLMNVADIHHKRELPNNSLNNSNFQVQPHEAQKFLPLNTWVVDDFAASGQRWLLHFSKPSALRNEPASSVGQLVKVELRRRVSLSGPEVEGDLGGVNEDEQLESKLFFYGLVLEFNLHQFTTELYPDELDQTFRVPQLCPQAQELDQPHEEVREPVELPEQEDELEDVKWDDERADELEFPSIESQLGLSQSYKLTSTWTFVDQEKPLDQYRVVEYFRLADKNLAEGELPAGRALFSRIDVTNTWTNSCVRFYLYHSINSMLRCNDEEEMCQQERRLDDWLVPVTAPVDPSLQFDSAQPRGSQTELRLVGVAGLWALASRRSATLQLYLQASHSEQSNRGQTIWALPKDSSELSGGAQVLFDFAVEYAGELRLPQFQLSSVTVESAQFVKTHRSEALRVDSIRVEPNGAQLADFELPDYCRDRQNLVELNLELRPEFAADLEQRRANFLSLGQLVPDFRFRVAYKLTIEWPQTGDERQLELEEWHSPRQNRGLVSVGHPGKPRAALKFWFSNEPDAGSSRIFEQPSGSTCRVAPNMSKLFHLREFLALIGGQQEQQAEVNFPLVDLWNAFARRVLAPNDAKLPGELIASFRRGSRLDVIKWSLYDEHSNLLVFEFTKTRDSRAQLKLNSVQLLPGHTSAEPKLRFTVRDAGELGANEEIKMQPPVWCTVGKQRVPQIAKQMNPGERLYVRSELTQFVQDSRGLRGAQSAWLLDEWLEFDGAYRAKLFRVAQLSHDSPEVLVTDQLMNLTTGEHFDLSQLTTCSTAPINELKFDLMNELKLSTSSKIAGKLFEVPEEIPFYGPVSLWLLAGHLNEQPIKDDSLNPLHLADLFVASRLNQWFATQVWRLEHPNRKQLYLKLTFDHSNDVGRHSILLKRLDAPSWHRPHDDSSGGASPATFIASEVLNYRFVSAVLDQQARMMDVEFRIPTGRGCKRSAEAKKLIDKTKDLIAFHPLSPLEFEYEATLSLVTPESHAFVPRPLINTGWLGRCPNTWSTMMVGELRANHQQQHQLDGTVRSFTRTTVRNAESTETLVRLLDERRGSCTIVKMPQGDDQATLTTLKFGNEEINLSNSFLAVFERSADEFERLQEFPGEANSSTIVVYEARMKELALNDWLKGEGSIVRTFTRTPEVKVLSVFHYHTSLKLDVIISGKAHLSLRLWSVRFRECADIIREAKLEACHLDSELDPELAHNKEGATRRLRSFELAFEPQDDRTLTPTQFNTQRVTLERIFLQLLLGPPQPLPVTQLGNFRLTFRPRDSTIWAHFNVMEPASLIHSFDQSQGRRLSFVASNSSSLSNLTKATSSLSACADLCEFATSGRCLAFAYCQPERSCQTLSLNIGHELADSKALHEYVIAEGAEQCVVYHGRPEVLRKEQRQHVDQLKEQLERQLGATYSKLKFQIAFENSTKIHFVARKFREVGGSDQQEDDEEQVDRKFVVVLASYELQLADHSKGQLLHFTSVGECLSACERLECALVSYCRSTQVCTLETNVTDYEEYRTRLNKAQRPASGECSVYSRDFTRHYEQFANTREPTNYTEKAINFSLFQCATFCQLQPNSDCLSFDFCLDEQDERSKPSACYLQSAHLMNDDLELVKQLEERKSKRDGRTGNKCAHYSRSLLADFRRVARTQMAEHKSIVFEEARVEKCALICRRDETCRAFEFCESGGASSTCYLSRESTTAHTLTNSTQCNVYLLNRKSVDELDSAPATPEVAPSNSHGSHLLAWALISLVAGLALGVLLAKLKL